jgi:hypothetical protein
MSSRDSRIRLIDHCAGLSLRLQDIAIYVSGSAPFGVFLGARVPDLMSTRITGP